MASPSKPTGVVRTRSSTSHSKASETKDDTITGTITIPPANSDLVTTVSAPIAMTATLIGKPSELMEVIDSVPAGHGGAASTDAATEGEAASATPADATQDELVYPKGSKLWLTFISLCIVYFLHGLDLTIVAVAVPRLTDQFKTVEDLGWYSAAYMMTASALIFLFGKVYTLYPLKPVYITGVVIFEVGSLVCTIAQTSKMFVVGRAIAGCGAALFSSGAFKVLVTSFPLHKQALYIGVAQGVFSVGMVSAPIIGGAIIDRFSWRGCFGINLPLGVVGIAFIFWGFHDTSTSEDFSLPWKVKLKKLDPLGTLLVMPSITCLLMALQWGGVRYGWSDWRIVLLFVMFFVTMGAFAYLQYRQGEDALIPPRIIKNRSILSAMWFCLCMNGILAMTEYYISVYFQGVRGLSPTLSGVLGVPMIAGLAVAGVTAGLGTNRLGYYYPFMYATSILAPIASGLLTTISLDDSVAKSSSLLGFLGFAVGLGLQVPSLAISASLPPKDVTMGLAVVGFGGGMGSALWICASATLFQERLRTELHQFSPTTNETLLENTGLSQIRTVVGADVLEDVLSGYNLAVVQTLYMPLALGIASLVATVLMERKSIKKKTQ